MKYIITCLLLFCIWSNDLFAQYILPQQLEKIRMEDQLYWDQGPNNLSPTGFGKSFHTEWNAFRIENATLDSIVWFDSTKPDNSQNFVNKFSYNYDDEKNHVKTTSYIWRENENLWDPQNEYFYEYDADKKIQTILRKIWDAELKVFEIKFKTEYFYKGDVLDRIKIFSKSFGDDWSKLFLFNIVYSDQLPVSQIQYVYDEKTDLWFGYRNWSYSYDSDMHLAFSVIQEFDYALSDWINVEEYQYEYDINGDPYEIYLNRWYDNLRIWLEEIKYELTFDEDHLQEDYLLPKGSIDSKYKLVQNDYLIFELETETFVQKQNGIYYYSDDLTSIAETNNTEIMAYPNPVGHFLTIDSNMEKGLLEILDMSGCRIFTSEFENGEPVNLEMIPPGMYVFLIKNKEQQIIFKIVKSQN